MKTRLDYVTNSSSSSFILGKKHGLEFAFNDKQKELLLQFIGEKLLGTLALTPDNTEEEISDYITKHYLNADEEEKIRKALKEGNDVYYGSINYECSEDKLNEIYLKVWEIIENESEGNFKIIHKDELF